MIRSRKTVTIPIALALVLLAGPALSGCSVQGIVNSATGGKVTLPGTAVPSDFPTTIPLATGTVELGAAIGDGKGGRIWNVTIDADSATLDSIAKQLTGAGLTDKGDVSTTTAGGTGSFEDAKYRVIVVLAKTDAKTTVNYTVTTK